MRVLLVALLLIAGCKSLTSHHAISPHDLTVSAIGETGYRAGIYFEQQHKLPEGLDVLPFRQGYANLTTDAWGHPLRYQKTEDGFTLSSLGKDGVAGGSGDGADIVSNYRIVDGELKEARP